MRGKIKRYGVLQRNKTNPKSNQKKKANLIMQYLPMSWSFQTTIVTSSKSQYSKIKVTACLNLLNAFCLPIPDLLFGKENLLVHTVCSSEPFQHFLLPKKKTAQSHRVHILHLCGGKKEGEKWGCGGVSDAVKKLHRQLKGNSRSISGKPGERQGTIFSILY